jgi:hypothetical protein
MNKKYITVGDLIDYLKSCDPNSPVVTEFGDHSYQFITFASCETALFDVKSHTITEDIFIGDVGEKTEYGTRVPVFLVI